MVLHVSSFVRQKFTNFILTKTDIKSCVYMPKTACIAKPVILKPLAMVSHGRYPMVVMVRNFKTCS